MNGAELVVGGLTLVILRKWFVRQYIKWARKHPSGRTKSKLLMQLSAPARRNFEKAGGEAFFWRSLDQAFLAVGILMIMMGLIRQFNK